MRPHADAVGLVHPDMNPFGAVRRAGGRQNLAQEFIGLLVIGQQDFVVVLQMLQRRPVQRPVQMAERLHTGAELDAEHIGVIVKRLQLGKGIAAALVAEVGLTGHFVGILGVHHAEVEAHQRHFAQDAAQRFGQKNRVAGTVEHDADRLKTGLFLDPGGRKRAGQQAERAVKLNRLGPGDGDGFAVEADGQPVAALPAHRHAAFGHAQRKFRRKGGEGLRAAGGQVTGQGDGQFHWIHLRFHSVQGSVCCKMRSSSRLYSRLG